MSAVTDKIRRACRLIRERGDDGVWLALVPEEQVLETAARGESQNRCGRVADHRGLSGIFPPA